MGGFDYAILTNAVQRIEAKLDDLAATLVAEVCPRCTGDGRVLTRDGTEYCPACQGSGRVPAVKRDGVG